MKIILLSFFTTLSLLVQAQTQSSSGWTTNEYENFVIATPDTVSYQMQPLETALGNIEFHIYYMQPRLNADPNQLYSYGYSDYPAQAVHSDSTVMVGAFLNSSSQGAAANLQGELINEKDIELNGYPGRDFEVSIQAGTVIDHFRTFLVGNRMYILQVITLAAEKENDRLYRFLDSFQLKAG